MTNAAPATGLAHDPRLTFDAPDRMRRSLRVANVSVQEMAEHLEVSRSTISNWINGRAVPRKRDLRLFALRTGFPLEWLETGKAPTASGEGPVLPELDSNQQPAGTKPGDCERRVIVFPSRQTPVVELPSSVVAS